MLGSWPGQSRTREGGNRGQEASPGPIKCICSAGRIYGSYVGWRLGLGAVCCVLAVGSLFQMCFPGLESHLLRSFWGVWGNRGPDQGGVVEVMSWSHLSGTWGSSRLPAGHKVRPHERDRYLGGVCGPEWGIRTQTFSWKEGKGEA